MRLAHKRDNSIHLLEVNNTRFIDRELFVLLESFSVEEADGWPAETFVRR